MSYGRLTLLMVLRILIALALLASLASCSRTTPSVPQTSKRDAAITSPTPPTKETRTAGRDLSDYAFGGHVVCHEALSRAASRCQPAYRKARDFIWNRWREKKRAYIIVMITSPDAGADVHIFIEPDEANLWRVVWRTESLYCASCPGPDRSGAIYQSPEMRSMERKRAGESDVDVPLGTRYLVFLDAYGNEVERL